MSSSAAWDLAFGIIAVMAIFALATGARRTIAIGVLLVLIPFQMIETRFGSSSVLIAYALAGVLIMSGDIKLRMAPALGLIILAYCISLVMADRDNLLMNAIEMFRFFSCLVVFLLAYNFARRIRSEKTVFDVLIAVNVLVVGYCALQLTAGPGERFVPFGIDTFAFNVNRNPGDPRLVGPFGNPGNTAGYFTLMTLVCAVAYELARGRRKFFLIGIIGFNLLGLVATGNRTGFLILVAMFPAFLFTFRRELGAKKITTYLIGGAAVLAVASMIAVSYTDFGRMFARLDTVTETEGGVPTTRAQTWPVAIEKIKQEPWFGEGPYFFTSEAAEGTRTLRVEFEDLGELTTAFDPYPHSLYLYLLRTVGIVGLAAVVGFFLWAWRLLYAASRRFVANDYGSVFVRLGLLLIPAFLVAQITLEFNRPDTTDYAQFIFALVGLLIGTADRDRQSIEAVAAATTVSHSPRHELGGRVSPAR